MSAAATTSTSGPEDLGYELGRYTIPAGERLLAGRRVNGIAIVVDAPIGDEGRVYLVERNIEQDGQSALRALIADYIATAVSTGQIPMASRGPLGGS